MAYNLNLTEGQEYMVVQPFKDFDQIVHPVGEKWNFVCTNYLPYDSGLTLHVIKDDGPVVYRFQWIKEEQADIIENFQQFVRPVLVVF